MNKKNFVKRLSCLALSAILLVLAGAESVQAGTITGITLDTTDFRSVTTERVFEKCGEMKRTVSGDDGVYAYRDSLPGGETVYLTDVMSCVGTRYYKVVYKGKSYNTLQSAVTNIKNVNKLEWKKTDDVVKQQGIIGDVLKGDVYAYIYSAPDDTKPENAYAHLPVGHSVQIIDKNYNKDWMKILYKDAFIAYIKKENVNLKDAYLIGAWADHMPFIKLAKEANLTYKGILKDYDKPLTKKQMCRVAVLWYQAMGHKLPKQKTKSPYKDTKDKYVIMAHQLGIIKSTSNKKFSPNEPLTMDTYNEFVDKLMEVAGAPSAAGYVARKEYVGRSEITRDEMIARLYKGLMTTFETGYLVNDIQLKYLIVPFDNQDVCLDVWEWNNQPGGTIGLWYCKDWEANQRFVIECNNGYYTLVNFHSKYVLTSGKDGLLQENKGKGIQKLYFEYNDDGSVCIRNGVGKYLDLKDGTAFAGGKLIFREKTGSSTQKFIFKM